jgi:urease accessory protein
MKKSSAILSLALAGVFLLPGLASAHILPGTSHGWHNGFAHPFNGLDHLLAMFAVGLWAAQYRGRAVWLIPLTFVSVMALGGVLGLTGASLPGVELGIALSVLVLGGLIATATRLQVSWGMCLVGLFALCHGFAHGHEMPASAGAIPFSAGFVAATLLLHGMGIAAGLYFQKQPRAIRLAGATIALCSVCFFANLI